MESASLNWYFTILECSRTRNSGFSDFALCNSLLPQIEKLTPIKLKSITSFIGGRISGNIYGADYTDDYESQQMLNEVKELVQFINLHKKDKKEKLAWQTWNKFLNGTTKLERDAKIQKMGDNEKEKYLVENLDPWISILKFRDFDGVDRPKLKEFSVRLQKIIKQRTFEDFEDEFDSE